MSSLLPQLSSMTGDPLSQSQNHPELILLQDDDDNERVTTTTTLFDYNDIHHDRNRSNGIKFTINDSNHDDADYDDKYDYSSYEHKHEDAMHFQYYDCDEYEEEYEIIDSNDHDHEGHIREDDEELYDCNDECEVVYAEEERSPFLLWNTMESRTSCRLQEKCDVDEEQETVIEVAQRTTTQTRRSIHNASNKRKSVDHCTDAVRRYQNFFDSSVDNVNECSEKDNLFASVMNEYMNDDCDSKVIVDSYDGVDASNDKKIEKIQSQQMSQNMKAQNNLPQVDDQFSNVLVTNITKHRRSHYEKHLLRAKLQSRPPSPIQQSAILQRARKLKGGNQSENARSSQGSLSHPKFGPDKYRFNNISIQNSKSIVGTRPSHWNKNERSRSQSAQVRRALLINATKTQTTRNSLHDSQYSQPYTPKMSLMMSQTDMATSKWNEDVDVRSMSFKLPFQRKFSVKVENSVSQEQLDIDNEVKAVSPQKSLSSDIVRSRHVGELTNSPKSSLRTRKRKVVGVLVGQFRKITRSVDANCARLHSGSYPFSANSKRRRDVNDPRNRSKSFADLTVIEMMSANSDGSCVPCLSYIHQIFVNDKISEKVEGYFWVYFLPETVRFCSIQNNCQLRVYDPVLILSKFIEGGLKYRHHQSILGCMICTQLCEKYPSCLSPLSQPEIL